MTRNVVLTQTQNQLVRALLASGRYQNASEAMHAGQRLLKQEEAPLAQMRQDLFEGLAQTKVDRLQPSGDCQSSGSEISAATSSPDSAIC